MGKAIVIILVAFLVASEVCVSGHPIPEDTKGSPWENIAREQRNLRPVQVYLLNKTVLPFLNGCYSENCCINREQLFCPTYYEMVINLNNSKRVENITENALRNILSVKDDLKPEVAQEFCTNFSKMVPDLALEWKGTQIKNLLRNSDHVYCTTVCFTQGLTTDFNEVLFTLNPFCKMISWMAGFATSEMIPSPVKTSEAKLQAQSITQPTKNVVVPAEDVEIPVKDVKIPVEVPDKIADKLVRTEKDPDVKQEKTNSTDIKTSVVSTTRANPIPPIEEAKGVPENTDGQISKQTGKDSSKDTQKIDNGMLGKGSTLDDNPNTNVDKPQPAEVPNQPKDNPDESPNDPNNEVHGKPNEPGSEGNAEINQEDPDDIFQQDSQKSDTLLYSGEDDNGLGDIRSPQADVKPAVRDPTLEKLIESNLRDITQKTGVGVSANYIPASDPFYEEAGSNFFTYFLIGMFVCIFLYVLYHNKTKVLALLLEGRRSQKGRGGRRKHTAQYTKLDTNLEEAITSSASARSSQIIY